MKSTDNLDWVERQREVSAWRVAAESALHSPYHDDRERLERAAYYNEQADRLEGKG